MYIRLAQNKFKFTARIMPLTNRCDGRINAVTDTNSETARVDDTRLTRQQLQSLHVNFLTDVKSSYVHTSSSNGTRKFPYVSVRKSITTSMVPFYLCAHTILIVSPIRLDTISIIFFKPSLCVHKLNVYPTVVFVSYDELLLYLYICS